MDHSRMLRIGKRVWGGFALFLSVGVFVCIVVNYAVSREVTWALYPAGAAALALGIVTPLAFGGKHRLLLSVVVLAALIMPFLMLMQHLSSTTSWAWPVGFPIAAGSMIALLLVVWLFRYTHINRWFCAGISTLTALPIALITNHVVSLHLNANRNVWETLLNVIGIAGASAMLFYVGVCGRQQKKTNQV